MISNFNENLYKRFGLELDVDQVKTGFKIFLKNTFEDKMGPLISPDFYKDSSKLNKLQRSILREACRQMFFDFSKYEDRNYGFGWFIDKVFDGEFSKIILRTQILTDLIYKAKFVNFELLNFAKEIAKYLSDYSVIGLTIKIYKTRPPQFLPTTNKVFEKEIKDTLGLLENSKAYSEVLHFYEDGLKEFLGANNISIFKNVVEDMYTSCDELVSIVSGNIKFGFRNLFIGKTPLDAKLNRWQLEIFNQLRDWMDKIKHGVEKDYTREDVEQIILLASTFIRTVINKNAKKS